LALLHRSGVEIGMRARRKATSRQGNDPALMSGSVERKREIDHGKTRTNEKRRLAALGQVLNSRARIVAPRIADEAIADAGECLQVVGFLVADGEDQRLCLDRRAIVEVDMPSFAVALPGNCGRLDNLRAAATHRLIEDATEVAREETPL